MTQMDNFRKVLGLPEPGQDKEQRQDEQPEMQVRNDGRSSTRKDGRHLKCVTIREDTHVKLHALAFWLYRNGEKKITLSELIEMLMDTYMEKHPKAKQFVDDCA